MLSNLPLADAVYGTPTLAFVQNIGPIGLIVILIIALLIFGKRLPDVARSMGKGIVEFKKGLRGVEDEVDRAGDQDASKSSPPPAKEFEPSKSKQDADHDYHSKD